MPDILLIRHGESESNAGLPTSDPSTIALTPKGLAQAACVAGAFARPPALIVTSPYLRTMQTAEPTIARFRQARLERWPVDEYTYLSLASRHNTTPQQRRPLIDAFWERCDPLHVDGDGAESFATLIERARQMLERMRRLEDDFVAIFSHGLFIRALLWVFLAGPIAIDAHNMRRYRGFASGFAAPNASILKVYVDGGRELFFGSFLTTHLPAHLLS